LLLFIEKLLRFQFLTETIYVIVSLIV